MERKDTPKTVSSDYVYYWCKEYGLSNNVVVVLENAGMRNGKDIIHLDKDRLDKLRLSDSEKDLLQNAVWQFKILEETVDGVIKEKLQKHYHDKKKYNTYYEIRKQHLSTMESPKPPCETDVMAERLRKRKERKKSKQGVEGLETKRSLAEQILSKRRSTVPERSASLPQWEIPPESRFYGSRSTQSTPSRKKRVSFADYSEDEERLIAEISDTRISNKEPSPEIRHLKKQGQDMLKTVDKLQQELFSEEELEMIRQIEGDNLKLKV